MLEEDKKCLYKRKNLNAELNEGSFQAHRQEQEDVESAVVADAMQLTMKFGFSMKLNSIISVIINSGTSGTFINNYNNDNSQTAKQTNNWSKSLSWLKIYR
ncbi:MAG: hypothetical protein K2K06_09820 [Oscillospiraceae bacterium]|nr:hypothetical protein [Oscillospiraceae bacterium]